MTIIGLQHLQPFTGSRRKSRRIGRGHGSGRGTFSGRGTKGQRARTGGRAGTTRRTLKPMIAHLPKFKGFLPRPKPTTVTTGQLEARCAAGSEVNAATLTAAGVIRSARHGLKVLAGGPALTKALTVAADAFSANAKAAIEQAGGKAIAVQRKT